MSPTWLWAHLQAICTALEEPLKTLIWSSRRRQSKLANFSVSCPKRSSTSTLNRLWRPHVDGPCSTFSTQQEAGRSISFFKRQDLITKGHFSDARQRRWREFLWSPRPLKMWSFQNSIGPRWEDLYDRSKTSPVS